jgi:hypothetical protein
MAPGHFDICHPAVRHIDYLADHKISAPDGFRKPIDIQIVILKAIPNCIYRKG